MSEKKKSSYHFSMKTSLLTLGLCVIVSTASATDEGVRLRNYSGGDASPTDVILLPRTDFNGDAKSDIIWQNSSTGQRSIWLMNGTVRTSSVNLPTIPIQWDIRNH